MIPHIQDSYTGRYRFLLPYLPKNMGKRKDNSNGYFQMNSLWVDVHVGRIEDLREGRLATILIYDPEGNNLSPFIEEICTQIRNSFFHSFFKMDKEIEENQLRWITVQGDITTWHDWGIALLDWDSKNKQYERKDSNWPMVAESDWCFTECLNDIQEKVRLTYTYLDPYYQTWREDAPVWVIDMLTSVNQYNQQNPNVKNTFKAIQNSLDNLKNGRIGLQCEIEKIVYKTIVSIEPKNYLERYVEDLNGYLEPTN